MLARLVLVLLIAVLLPLRGALASAAFCEQAGQAQGFEQSVVHGHAGATDAGTLAEHAGAALEEPAPCAEPAHEDAGAKDKCVLSCLAMPLASGAGAPAAPSTGESSSVAALPPLPQGIVPQAPERPPRIVEPARDGT